jgi:hypothetical protein
MITPGLHRYGGKIRNKPAGPAPAVAQRRGDISVVP